MSPEDMHDGVLLRLLERGMMRGATVNEQWYARREGERPIDFIERVRREERERQNREEAEKALQARASQDSSGPADNRSGAVKASPGSSVQATEESLEATLEAKVARLQAAAELAEQEYICTLGAHDRAARLLENIQADLAKAKKFLESLKNDNKDTPETTPTVGGDIPE